MAHFAQLDENNIVLQVIVVANSDTSNPDGSESEQIGIEFCKGLFGASTIWVQTSYNGNFRKNYAGAGYTYDAVRDAFIPPQPYPSWLLNEDTARWYPPVPPPTVPPTTDEKRSDRKRYRWDEPSVSWVEVIQN